MTNSFDKTTQRDQIFICKTNVPLLQQNEIAF